MSAGLGLPVGEAEGADPGVAGGQSSWAEALESHRRELLGFAARALGDRDLAEEAVQETFLRALRARRSYDAERGALRTWLFAIEHRVLADLLKARRANVPAEEEAPEPSARDEDPTRRWQVEQALRELSLEHRQVILEIYYRGLSSRQLAGRLGVPEGTVRSRLFYALRQLRRGLERSGWPE